MGTGHQVLWLTLIIGNSRWHWGAFEGDHWLGSWHTAPLSEAQVHMLQQLRFTPSTWQQLDRLVSLPSGLMDRPAAGQTPPELWLASVVKAPLSWLADYPALHPIETADVPLENAYSTLGVDRALALVGAGETLHDHTDQLPSLDLDLAHWPQRWATDTAGAIASGILHTQLAGIRDFIQAWAADWPGGAVVLTGGDSATIHHYLTQQPPALAQRMSLDPDLGFWGLRVCRQRAHGAHGANL